MNKYFLNAARMEKKEGGSQRRIQMLQQMADRKRFTVSDFSQFGQLIPINSFKKEYDYSIYKLDEDAQQIMLYPRMYYIQLLKDDTWFYQDLFEDLTFRHPNIKWVEERLFEHIKSSTKVAQ
jgi:hypothetical protein